MAEIISGKAIDFLVRKLEEWANNLKKDFDWKNFFTNTGDLLSRRLDAEESFRQDLIILFSPNNMKELAKTLKKERGYTLTTNSIVSRLESS